MRTGLNRLTSPRATIAVVVAAVLAATGATGAAASPAAGWPANPLAAASPASGVPVPVPGFRATALTWISARRGFVLGTAPCPAPSNARPASGTPTPCTYLVGTKTGGTTWKRVGSVPAGIATAGEPGQRGVTEVRFATKRIGWAYGPLLLRTTDGGHTWTRLRIPGGGKQVVGLAADRRGAYAVVAPCAWSEGGACSSQPYTYWRNPTLTGAWTRIPLRVTPPKGLFDFAAGVAVHGTTVYAFRSVSNPPGTIFQDKLYASTDGVHFTARSEPCPTAEGLSLSQAVPTSATSVALLCQSLPSLGAAAKEVLRSTNAGRTFTSAGYPPSAGITAQLAASASGNLAVTSVSGASFIDINDTRTTAWTWVAEVPDGGLGWNDVVFASDTAVWVVYAPAADVYPGAPGQVFVSRDGGRHWRVATV